MSIVDVGLKRDALAAALLGRRRVTLAPPSRLPLDAWADAHRVLTSESSSIPGAWMTSNVEVARGPFRAVTEFGVRKLTGMASAQIFKTSLCEVLIGRYMHLEPCPMLIFEPTKTTAEDFDSDKLEPMIRATPPLRDLFGGRAGLAKQNPNFLQSAKTFPGGFLKVFTADSTSNLAFRSVKVVMFDEVDKFKVTRDGDVIALGEERLKRFKPNDLSIRVSTPTITGESRIAAEYDKSDQRKPYVSCPGCGDYHFLEWENVIIPKSENGKANHEDAYYASECCGYIWNESDRIKIMTTAGSVSWRQTKTFECCDVTQDPEVERLWDFEDMQSQKSNPEYPVGYAVCKECGERAVDASHAGFWAWEIYNPVTSVVDTVRAFLGSKGDKNQLQNFINSKLARTFSKAVESVKVVDPEHIAARSEPPWPGVPAAVKCLTAGVDIQGDRLEIEIVGWGDGDESWSLDYQVIPGDPQLDNVWLILDQYINTPLIGEDGRKHHIQATCIDSGYLPDTACTFSAPRHRKNRVWAIKSDNGSAGSRTPIWPARAASAKRGAPIYRIGSQSAKDKVYHALSITQPGPGYMHIPSNRDARWYEQLTAEHLVRVSIGGGREGTFWRPKTAGKRNEAIDCRVYALAALHGLRALGVIKQSTAPGAAIPAKPEPAEDHKPAAAAKKPLKRRKTSSFWDA